MLAVLIASFVFLIIATLFGLPVSTTHTIVAGVISFGILESGMNGINTTTMRNVLISWVVSPVTGIIMGWFIYFILHKFVLTSPNGEKNNKIIFPIMAGVTVATVVAFIIVGLAKQLKFAYWIPVVVGVSLFIVVSIVTGLWIFPWYLRQNLNSGWFYKLKSLMMGADDVVVVGHPEKKVLVGKTDKEKKMYQGDGVVVQEDTFDDGNLTSSSMEQEVMEIVDDLGNLPQQNPYISLMIMTAAAMGFAHGANDIANSVGPYSVVLEYVMTGTVADPNWEIPIWIFVASGAFLVLGIVVLGMFVIETIGEKITKLNYAAGFSAQYSTCVVVLFASLLGLPISTTHVIVGAVTGTAFVTKETRAGLKGQWVVLLKIVIGWVLTIIVSSALTLGIYALLRLGLPL